jgi:hypothetical protein
MEHNLIVAQLVNKFSGFFFVLFFEIRSFITAFTTAPLLDLVSQITSLHAPTFQSLTFIFVFPPSTASVV